MLRRPGLAAATSAAPVVVGGVALTYRRGVIGRTLLLSLGLAAACADPAGVVPAAGRTSGGEPLRISGRGFREHGPPVVYVGPRAAKAVVVESDRLITVVTPEADAPGVVAVAVHFADGEVLEYADAFAYEDRGVVLRASDAR